MSQLADKPEVLTREEQRSRSQIIATATDMKLRKKSSMDTATDDEGNKEINIMAHLHEWQWTEERFSTSFEKGLTSAQVLELREEFGYNELKPPPTTAWYWEFWHHMTGFFSLLLWLAAFLCFFSYALKSDLVENLYLGIVLSIVTFMTGCFSFYQDAKSASVMAGFKNMLPPEASVIRDGVRKEIPAIDLVPGDICFIKSGSKIPADLRIVVADSFKVDNSSLTGETEHLKRTPDVSDQEHPLEATNLAFYGTGCRNGTCGGIVIQTGDDTVIGSIANLAASTDNIKTPIAIEIEHFITIISGVAITLGVAFVIIGFVKSIEPITNLVFGIGIIVANVPEGLLATVTVSLTLTSKRMASKNVLVKNLEAVETLGSTTVIASDKTGTLTCNRMTVAHMFFDKKTYINVESGDLAYNRNSTTFHRLLQIATLCNAAYFTPDDAEKAAEEKTVVNSAKPILQRNTKGDASESALLKFTEKNYVAKDTSTEAARLVFPQVHGVPFNSANKFQLSIHKLTADKDGDRLMVMKGAPERIVNRCDYMLVEGKEMPMDEELLAAYQESIQGLMENGERVLGMCCATLGADKYPDGFEYSPDEKKPNYPLNKGDGLVFVGLISLMDPPRAAVPAAVMTCVSAGIKVIMVTGDHPETAQAIARNVNIIRDEVATRRDVAKFRGCPVEDVDPFDMDISARVITGTELSTLSPEMLDKCLDFDQIVFARTSPKQKLDIVQALQKKTCITRGHPAGKPLLIKHVVAVTGDGVNDSPALKAADIGVAMGIVGADVAKDSADMILLDDNFASIVHGVEEGRLIFDNLKKSIAYTLSSNIPEISPFLVYILAQIPLPLPTVLILLIDLGTDMVPAISLAYENKEANIMQKPPRDMRVDRLVTAKLVSFSYLQVGVVQALAGFYTYFVVLNDYGFDPAILPNLADGFLLENVVNDEYLLYQGERFYMKPCAFSAPGICHNPEEALAHAQCAFFISIIVVQWADLVACKTRELSLAQQGMHNGVLNFGLCMTLILGCLLCYIEPLNVPLRTRPIAFVHWLPAVPFSVLILMYDETRKYLMRALPKNNWIRRNTYY